MRLAPITKANAEAWMQKYSQYREPFDMAVCVKDGDVVHGVITMNANGETFGMGHISTDGNAHIGSLLYGGMCRVAKALGYYSVNI